MQGRWRVHSGATWMGPERNNRRNRTGRGDSGAMKKRLSPQEIDARLKFVVGCVLAGVLTITTIGVLYALVFVTQPIGAQAENDKMFFGVLSSVATFITGTLAGLMISTGRNPEDKDGDGVPDDQQ
ncbi:MAG: hypothetical protein EB003_11280 [Flavobacteriia bacterium]|nr:hypothetical protein [Flavobacteriia bacterium]